MSLRMEPGQMYSTWAEFKEALDAHCRENKVLFNISNAKTVEQANNMLKKKPFFDIQLKYASIILVCKHYGSYKSLSSGLRPKQRSYKINCKAYISVSACRKENYLIIRDSYHIHSHPCSEEIYNSYPEVRRMTKEERKMVGTLMELGVPTSQIKNAVGRNVTQKDLQNAKTHIKAVKLGIKSDDSGSGQRRRKVFREGQDEQGKDCLEAGEMLSESDEDGRLHEGGDSMSSIQSIHHTSKEQSVEEMLSRDASNASYTVTVGEMDPLGDARDSLEIVEMPESTEKDPTNSEKGGLTGLLAAAGLSSDSVVLTVNSQGHGENSCSDEVKNSYTVTVSLPDGDVTQTGTNLQELLKGLPLGKVVAKPLSPDHSPVKVKMEELTSPEVKSCIKCGGYISPLDGHDKCLSCLGPEHIHEVNCENCLAMSQEQFNIRRKKMVALRMKALKEMRRKRSGNNERHDSDSDYSSSVRKSKRARKPINFGPDMYVDDAFLFNGTSDSKTSRRSSLKSSMLCSEDTKDVLSECIPKIEPMDEEDNSFDFNPVEQNYSVGVHNSQRFDHILSQAKVFEDVTLTESERGSLHFSPGASICSEFHKAIANPELPPFPPTLMGKYILNSKFESAFCSEPPPLIGVTDPAVDVMGKGLVKLVKNATAQTRIAVYDKLFTRVGVGMADEALSILSELYSKVTEVTEISQEDLTNSLQTALDTIQALKDVLEELGVMSKDAISTASHQRSISVGTLQAARKSLTHHRLSCDETVQRRGKFLPFARAKASATKSIHELSAPSNSSQNYSGLDILSASPAFKLKQLAEKISTGQADPSISGLPMVTMATPHDGLDANSEISAAFIMSGKEFTVSSLNSDLLHSLNGSKDGIIELHVMKSPDDLMDAEETTVEEVIQAD